MSFAKAGIDQQLLEKRRVASLGLQKIGPPKHQQTHESLLASIFRRVESGLQTQLGDVPSARAYHASCQSGTQVFIYGGCASTDYGVIPFDDFYIFDVTTMKWARIDTPDGPGPRCKHNMCYYEGKIYLFAGWDGQRRRDDLWSYHIATNSWAEIICKEEKKKMVNWPTPHSSAASCIVGGVWIVVGRGETGAHRKYGCEVDFFDFERSIWCPGGARFDARAGHTITPVRSMRAACMIGGRKEQPVYFFPMAKYAPDCETQTNLKVVPSNKDSWTVTDTVPTGPPLGRSFHGAVAIPHTSHVLIHGGFLEGNTRTTKCLFDSTGELRLYDDRDDSWYFPETSCLPARSAHTLAVFMAKTGDDTAQAYVLLFGGADRGEIFNDMWIQKLDLQPEDKDGAVVSIATLGTRAQSTNPKVFGLQHADERRAATLSKGQELKAEYGMKVSKKNQEWERKRSLVIQKEKEDAIARIRSLEKLEYAPPPLTSLLRRRRPVRSATVGVSPTPPVTAPPATLCTSQAPEHASPPRITKGSLNALQSPKRKVLHTSRTVPLPSPEIKGPLSTARSTDVPQIPKRKVLHTSCTVPLLSPEIKGPLSTARSTDVPQIPKRKVLHTSRTVPLPSPARKVRLTARTVPVHIPRRKVFTSVCSMLMPVSIDASPRSQQ
eukprot:GEMP01008344.1.p1 GENE.GEMP01008344.1~~GEMP01008344.1.p1  ORF type:complete len:663 (+),score=153.54 GEMP01008344.1:158-2146(+)